MGLVARYVPIPQCGEDITISALLGFFNQCQIIQISRCGRCCSVNCRHPLEPYHIPLQYCLKLLPALLQVYFECKRIAGNCDIFLCHSGYVDLQACTLIGDLRGFLCSLPVFISPAAEHALFPQYLRSVTIQNQNRIAQLFIHHLRLSSNRHYECVFVCARPGTPQRCWRCPRFLILG